MGNYRGSIGVPGQVLVLILLVWLCITPVTSAPTGPTIRNPGEQFPMGPFVTGTAQDSAAIRFIAGEPCTPVLIYGKEDRSGAPAPEQIRVVGATTGTIHTLRLTGLDAMTLYNYSVEGCGFDKRVGRFRTLPDTGTCTFVVYGDTREQFPLFTQIGRHSLVASRIAHEPGILFTIHSGDLVADPDDAAEWVRFLSATEELRSTTTFRAIPGNHDTNRSLLGSLLGTEGYDAFSCGSARIVLLDSTDRAAIPLEEQAAMLFAGVPQDRVTVVILHHPIFSSEEKHYGGYSNLQRLVPLFREHGVQLVFSSHVHAFEQVERGGITYITEGRGGAPAYPLNRTRIAGSVAAAENALGYSRVTVGMDGGIRVDVVRVADVSPDLRTVTKVYPPDTYDVQIAIPARTWHATLPDISRLPCLFSGKETGGLCRTGRV